VRKLQSYKPRVTFDSLTVVSRPLGVKLCSNDGRYLAVVQVDEGSSGDKAGIMAGDLIVQVNDDCFESAREGLTMVESYPLPLEIHVRRILDVLIEDGTSSLAGGSSSAALAGGSRDSSALSVLAAASKTSELTPRSRE